jgi:post-segregation antitoxin (ccd killing protein)
VFLIVVDSAAAAVDEKIRSLKVTTDVDLLNELRKTKEMDMDELNDVLLRLEIRGLITVSWMDKERRRIEFREPKAEPARQEST